MAMGLELSAGAWLTGGYIAEDRDYSSPLTQNPSTASKVQQGPYCFYNQMFIVSFKIKKYNTPTLCSSKIVLVIQPC